MFNEVKMKNGARLDCILETKLGAEVRKATFDWNILGRLAKVEIPEEQAMI